MTGVAERPDEPDLQEVTPLAVGSLGTQAGDIDSRQPMAMMLTLDVDEVPGLREAFERQRAGHDFDVTVRWGASMSADPEEPPLALVEVRLPEPGIAFRIAIDVDRFPDSLAAGVRAEQVMLMTGATAERLQREEYSNVIDEDRPMVLPPADAAPVFAALQQRHDELVDGYRPVIRPVAQGESRVTGMAFLRGASAPTSVRIQYREVGTPSVIISDPALADVMADLSERDDLEGRWQALYGEQGRHVLRFDAFDGEECFASYVMPDEELVIVRAGASGAHSVVLMDGELSDDQERAEAQWRSAIHCWVPHVEALRYLLVKAFG